MAPQISRLLALLSLAGLAGPAETGGQGVARFYGIPSGHQVQACGIEIDDGAIARLSPFLDAAADLQGRLGLTVTRWSAGNVAEMREESRIDAGKLEPGSLLIDHPDRLRVTLRVWTEQGTEVCLLEHQFSLGRPTTDI